MEINGLELGIDLEVILQACGIREYRDRGTDYRAHCPAHSERTPSWDISKTDGTHNCFGCGYKGNVVSLLVDYHPEIENEIQAMRWLFERFKVLPERRPLDIERFLQRDKQSNELDESILDAYDFRHTYLYERGFDERTLQAFRVGWCEFDEFVDSKGRQTEVRQAITIPWRDRKGKLRLVQYRLLSGRYMNRGDAESRKSTLFGLDKVVKRGADRVALCEGVFDAMYCWQAGVPAVAIGSAFISSEQARELQLAGVKRVDLFLDNPDIDDAGRKGREHAVKLLGPYFRLTDVVFPRSVKDANDFTLDELRSLTYKFV